MLEKLKENRGALYFAVAVVVFILVLIFVFGNAVDVNNDNGNSDSYENEAQTEPQTPMSEWGFYNSDDWGNKLVQIVGNPDNYMDQSYKNFNDEYVVISEGSGFWDFYPETSQVAQGSFYFNNKQTSTATTYVVTSNDIAYIYRLVK